jgi:hypothetical protein
VFHEPEAPKFELVVRASARNGLQAEPKIHSEQVLLGSANRKFSITAEYIGDPAAVLRTRTSAAWLTVKVVPAAAKTTASAAKQWQVECDADLSNADAEATLKGFVGLSIEKDGVVSAKVNVPVIIRLVSDIKIHPSRIFFGDVQKGHRVTRTIDVTLQSKSGLDIGNGDLIRAEPTHPISVRCEKIEDTKWRLHVTLSVPPDASAELMRGSLNVEYAAPIIGKEIDRSQATALSVDRSLENERINESTVDASRYLKQARVEWVGRIAD